MRRVNIKYLLASLILIIVLLLGTSCQLLPSVDTSPPPSPPPTQATTPIDPNWTPPVDNSAPVLPDIASVVAEVKPSVVAINTEAITYDIFGRAVREQMAGSGWIIDEDGLIVTNNHVVEGAESITVILADGRTFSVPMETVRTDPLTDLAVFKINGQNLPAANMGDSTKLRVGDWVVAIGNSLNLGVTPSEGIIRSLEASVPVSEGQTLYGLIGTSAAINPGNSGGPLVNMAGEVIGITTVKIAMVGIEGMGWAISINTAIPVIEELVLKGYVVRPYLGIVFADVNQYLIGEYGLAVDRGAFVTQVVPDSPAGRAGLKAGDVIVSLDGKQIFTGQELVKAIHSSQVGKQVEIIFWRGETETTTYATLIERPQPS